MATLKHQYTTDPIKGETIGDKITKGFATATNVAGNVKYGVAKGIEGIADFFATASGFFGNDEYREKVKQWVEQDNADAIYKWVDWNPLDLYLYPYLADQAEAAGKQKIANLLRANTLSQSKDVAYHNAATDFAEGLAQSAGGMLLDYAVGGAVGGIAGAAGALPSVVRKVQRGVSLATLGVRAAGTGTEEAYQDGATFYRGAAYGAAQGATEVATEMLFDSPVNRVYGKGLLSPVKQSVTKTGVRLARDLTSEAIEEVASELVNPLERSIYKGKSAFREYGTGDYWKQVGLAGASGAAMAGIMGAGQGSYTTRGSADYYAREALADMTKRENLDARGKLTDEKAADFQKSITANVNNASAYLSRMSDEARAKYLEKNKGLARIFDEKGKVRAEFAERMTGNGATAKYASVNARYGVERINRDLEKASAKTGEKLTAYDGTLNEAEESRFNSAKRLVNKLNTETGGAIGLVLTSESNTVNAFQKDGNIYLAKNHLTDENLAKTIVEEAVHTLQTNDENGKYDNDYYKLLHALALTDNKAAAIEKSIRARYPNLAEVDFDEIEKKYASGEKLSADEQEMVDEIGAQVTAEILGGNEAFVKRFAENPKFAERFLNAFEQVKNALSRMTDKEAKAAHRKMLDTERLLLKALAENGYSYVDGHVVRKEKKEPETVESDRSGDTGRGGEDKRNNVRMSRVTPAQDRAYNSLAEKYKAGTATKEETAELERMVRETARVAGYSAPMYHGSKRAGLTVFKDWQYFTKNKEYAERYARDGEDSLYRVFVKMERPFDTRNEDARKLFEKARSEYGLDKLQEDGLPDWTDGYDLADYIDEADLDYDSILLNEGGDMVDGKPVSRGISYEVRKSAQVKSADPVTYDNDGNIIPLSERFNTEKDDIRFSRVTPAQETPKTFEEAKAAIEQMGGKTTDRNILAFFENGVNSAGLYTKHKENNKNNVIVRKWLSDTYPDLQFEFYNDKGTGTVTIGSAKTSEYIRREKQIEAEKYAYEQKRKRWFAFVTTPSGNQSLFESIENFLKKSGVDGYAEESHSAVASNSFYVRGNVETDNSFTIKISDHFTMWQQQQYSDDYFIDLNDYASTEEVKERIRQIFEEESKKDDIRFSRGQNAKFAANHTGERVYSRKETQAAVEKMVADIVLGDEYQQFQGELKGKGKKSAVDYLWERLNRTPPDYRRAVAEKAAQQIIDSTVMTETWADPTVFPEKDQEVVERAKSIVSMMADYMHRINFENIKGDVKFVKDDKFKDYARMWASKDAAKAISPYQLSDAFAEIGIDLGAENDADIFLKAVDEYEKAKETIQNAVEKVALAEYGSKEELDAVKQKLVDEILDVFETGGQESKFSKLVSQYRNSIQFMKDMRSITDKVKEIKLQGKRFASDQRPENLKRALSTLTGMVRGNMLSPKVARQACLDLYEWYSPDNAMFKESPMYHETMRDMMETVGKGSGALTAEEMEYLEHIVDFMDHLDKNFKRVYRNGEWKDADNDAKRFVETARKANKDLPRNPVAMALQKMGRNYVLAVMDPASIARMADRYGDGFFTRLFGEIRDAAFLMDKTKHDLNRVRSDFYGEHKGYKPEKRTVNVRGTEMTAAHAISLYMTTKRKQAWRGLVKSGYRLFMDGAEKAGPALGDHNVNYTDEQIEQMVAEFRRDVENQLTDTDKEYVSTMEKILKEAGRLKAERDMQRYGFTNATEDYYYPILRSNVVKDLDTNLETGKYFDIVSNLSMNKDTKQNAMGELGIQTVDAVVTRHIKQTAMYYALANVVDNFNTISNLNLSDNAGKPLTVRGTVEEGAFGKAALSYFQKMIKDLEGVSGNTDAADKAFNQILGKVRSNVAMAHIGGNPKVIATQGSSLFAGLAILSPRDYAKGMSLIRFGDASKLDQYSEIARLRNEEYGAARGETLVDNINKVGEFMMKGVSATDRMIVQIEWAACQARVARTQNLEIGSEENLKAAGKLMDRVILETQQSSTLSERSGLARSNQEILKGLAMFRMDAMKQIGRVIDGFGELATIREDLNAAKNAEIVDEDAVKELQGRQKTVRKKTAKAVGALVGTALYQALIGLLFAAFLNRLKDKEPEEIVKDTVVDGFAGLVTGLPVISQAVEFFADGYEVENFTISAFNDLLNSTKSLANLASGKATAKDVKNALRTSLYAGGNLLGIPVRNTYNYFYGTVNTINDYAGYKVHSLLYSDNYKTELYKAIEEGDADRVQMLSKLLADTSLGGYGKNTKEAIIPLVEAGYTVLPKEIGDSVTYDGRTYEMTARQRARFKKVYGQSEAAVQKVVSLQSYKKLDPAVKAKTIKSIYDMYYGLAVDDMLGTDTENKNVLFSYAIDPDKLALIVAQAKSIEADRDKNGKVIAGSKKQKVVAYINGLNLTAAQKYMIMGYLGYKNTKGEEQVNAYIGRLKLSKKEKETLLAYSGYGEADDVA